MMLERKTRKSPFSVDCSSKAKSRNEVSANGMLPKDTKYSTGMSRKKNNTLQVCHVCQDCHVSRIMSWCLKWSWNEWICLWMILWFWGVDMYHIYKYIFTYTHIIRDFYLVLSNMHAWIWVIPVQNMLVLICIVQTTDKKPLFDQHSYMHEHVQKIIRTCYTGVLTFTLGLVESSCGGIGCVILRAVSLNTRKILITAHMNIFASCFCDTDQHSVLIPAIHTHKYLRSTK
jgi:hypothetical protein